MNANPYANGSVIYTQSGYYARQFARYTDGGQVGINVGIPVPVGFIPFSGHKKELLRRSSLPWQRCLPLLYGKQIRNTALV